MRKLDYEKLVGNIQNWIKNYIDSNNLKGIVVGISGGIDSAVTAEICVKAVGRENVIGVGLPCESITQEITAGKELRDVRYTRICLRASSYSPLHP